ncbi:MAG: nitroreductase/quinone reductase family protein [Acidimicrobiia bacterium]
MTDEIIAALESDRTIDITTTGRQSGQPRRKEMWFHNVDGRIFITGLPGRRDWYANLLADPSFTFHLKESVRADLDATARPVATVDEKREILEILLPRIGHLDKIERWLTDGPLVEVSFA